LTEALIETGKNFLGVVAIVVAVVVGVAITFVLHVTTERIFGRERMKRIGSIASKVFYAGGLAIAVLAFLVMLFQPVISYLLGTK
jgi:uncharacterized membrane protein